MVSAGYTVLVYSSTARAGDASLALFIPGIIGGIAANALWLRADKRAGEKSDTWFTRVCLFRWIFFLLLVLFILLAGAVNRGQSPIYS